MAQASNDAKSKNQKRMGPAPFASFEDLSDEMDSPSEKEVAVIRLPGISEQEVPLESESKSRHHHAGVSLIGAALKSPHSSSPNSLPHSPLPNKMKLVNTPRIDISRASSSSHHDSRDSTPEREIFESAEADTVKLGLGFKEDDALELRLSTEELDFHDVTESKTHKPKHRSASPEFDELYINNRKDSQCSDVILLSISGRTSRISSIGSQGSAQSRLSNASHISIVSGQSAYSQCSSPHKTLLETSFCGYRGSQSNIAADNPDTAKEDLEKAVLSRKPNPAEAVLAENVSNKVKSAEAKQVKDQQQGENRPKLPRKIISKSGVEYIYIPLKGPMPSDDSDDKNQSSGPAKPGRKKNYADLPQKTQPHQPKYIRIKLKPDHCYDDNDSSGQSMSTKPDSLNLPQANNAKLHQDNNFDSIQKHARSLTNSPKLLRKDFSPCQAVSRRNSFATLFRTGPDSPNTPKQKRKNTLSCVNVKGGSKGANASSTESVDSKGKHKSVLSLFKFPKETKAKSSEEKVRVRSADAKIKHYKEERPLNSESIRIPLHSPTYYENKTLLNQDSSQDSQVTVVEIVPSNENNHAVEINRTETDDNGPNIENNTITTTVDIELVKEATCSSENEKDALATSDSLNEVKQHEEHNSSESEREVELSEYKKCDKLLLHPSTETERKAIVLQQDSFEDELPYVPTTLPQERSAAVPILPSKQRCVLDMKTCPIERPRSTTPIHASGLENYFDGFATKYETFASEKLKISLPRNDGVPKSRVPLGEPLPGGSGEQTEETPPPLPPKGIQKSWINFEEVPEKRKPPKRIQTIPSRGQIDISGLVKENVVYTYVNPEECKCECHEHKEPDKSAVCQIQEDELPLLNQDENGVVNS